MFVHWVEVSGNLLTPYAKFINPKELVFGGFYNWKGGKIRSVGFVEVGQFWNIEGGEDFARPIVGQKLTNKCLLRPILSKVKMWGYLI